MDLKQSFDNLCKKLEVTDNKIIENLQRFISDPETDMFVAIDAIIDGLSETPFEIYTPNYSFIKQQQTTRK